MRWLVALLLLVSTAHADQTIRNYYDANQTTTGTNLYDINGNHIDVHWGNIVQFGADQPIYWHGTVSYCGWSPGNVSLNWCGIKTYKCANQSGGPDLLNCQDMGLIVDPASGTPAWSTTCAPAASTFQGCWQAPMIYDAVHNNYVLYMECQCATGTLYYFNCTGPAGPCTQGGTVTLSHQISTGTPFVDDDGTAYYIYDVPGASNVYIDKLNSTYTAWDGVNTNTLGLSSAETPIIFKHGTNYIIGWGGLCGDCGGGGGLHVTNTCANILTCSPSGNQTNLENTNNACFSQILTVAKIQAGGQTTWLYQGIKFNQQVANNNHGATEYYWQPLTFVSDQAQTFSCSATITIPGITGSTYPTPAASNTLHPTPVDQSDFANNTFSEQFIYNVDNTHQWLQTFVPTNGALFGVGFGLGFNAVCSPSNACSSLNPGTATLDVVTVDGSNNITGTLSSTNFDNTNTGWSSTWKFVEVNLHGLTVGATYGLRLRASGVGTNMYWISPQIAQPPSAVAIPTPYSAGVFRQSSNSGSTFTTVTNGSLMFSTFPVVATPIVSGVVAH